VTAVARLGEVVATPRVYLIELHAPRRCFYTGRRDPAGEPIVAQTPAGALRYESARMATRDMVHHCDARLVPQIIEVAP
jgi:hypothetical protein